MLGPTAVKQNLIINCFKPTGNINSSFDSNYNETVLGLITEILKHIPIVLQSENSRVNVLERTHKFLYDKLLKHFIVKGFPVPIDSKNFRDLIEKSFVERDGMFFTKEQVQEYDRKKAEVPDFVQLSIFVANEQDAIYWLRNILEKGSKTEQDLHPLWMKEVAGNMRKGDTLPEMRTILEDNFLKNEKGQWYLPDPENEADLEKQRTNRLLKQFKAIVTEVGTSKKKIKEVRVEALRAGFKQCYQDKEFETIVKVGERIPNKLLLEDEVLLQFYDIATSRV